MFPKKKNHHEDGNGRQREASGIQQETTGDNGRQRNTTGDNGRQWETTGDDGRQRETARDNGRQREATGDNAQPRLQKSLCTKNRVPGKCFTKTRQPSRQRETPSHRFWTREYTHLDRNDIGPLQTSCLGKLEFTKNVMTPKETNHRKDT